MFDDMSLEYDELPQLEVDDHESSRKENIVNFLSIAPLILRTHRIEC